MPRIPQILTLLTSLAAAACATSDKGAEDLPLGTWDDNKADAFFNPTEMGTLGF